MSNRPGQLERDQLLEDAADLQSPSLRKFLRDQYCRICRVAHALCRNPNAAKKTVVRVMRASGRFLPKWKSAQEADSWFLHHTILTIREISGKTSPRPANDYLIQHADNPGLSYLAFVRALRHLPQQQREAFLLSRGEHLDSRQLAIAMDCSTSAAANHLAAATDALKAIAGDAFEAQTTALAGVYASLTPPEEKVLAGIAATTGSLHRNKWRHRLKILLGWLILALLAWTVWQLSRMIVI
ncbi:MAG: sigma factor-like helix-turn-helix DNA-binding protein [Tepidisphaeraceae bacterium]